MNGERLLLFKAEQLSNTFVFCHFSFFSPDCFAQLGIFQFSFAVFCWKTTKQNIYKLESFLNPPCVLLGCTDKICDQNREQKLESVGIVFIDLTVSFVDFFRDMEVWREKERGFPSWTSMCNQQLAEPEIKATLHMPACMQPCGSQQIDNMSCEHLGSLTAKKNQTHTQKKPN